MPTDDSVAEPYQTVPRRLYLPFSFVLSRQLFAVTPWFPSSTMSNSIDSRSFPSTTARPNCNDVPFPSSTMSNSIDTRILFPSASSLPVSNVKLHRPTVCQVQSCRIPSAPVQGGLSVNNVELHRLSNTIQSVADVDQSCVQSRDISRTIRHGELSSCAIHTLNTCNLISNAA